MAGADTENESVHKDAYGHLALGVATRAAPDGYSLMFGTNGTHAANRYLYKDFAYDPVRDFVPVHGLFADFNVLVAGVRAPFATFDEFLVQARARAALIPVTG